MSNLQELSKVIIVTKTCDNKITVLKELIAHHCITLNLECSDIDVTILAYYMLYGINKTCDKRIIADLLSHLDIKIASQTIYNSRNRLKKYEFIAFTNRKYSINAPLNLNFEVLDTVTYALQLKEGVKNDNHQ